ncbi:MAG: nucleotide exchange factor GrpE [Gammaproteobacteria bacterium]|nr:nucleotide exchange factor GrpE [Gammaproteobacteria bacterium]
MNGQAERPEQGQEENIDLDAAEATAGSADQEEDSDDKADAVDAADDAAAALAAAEAKAAENWDRYLRTAAEIENVRKRSARDVEHAHRFALERFGTELLAVRDALELGLESSDNADVESLIEGSKATLKQLATVMERFGVEVVDPAGEPFDPERHEAISVQPSSDVEPGTVITVVQKGYVLNGRLLRPALVIVSEK